MGEPERREALRRLLAELARGLGEAAGALEEAKRELLRGLEEALGEPLTEEGRLLRGLYDFTPPPQPGLEELRRMVLESLGAGGGEVDLVEAIRAAARGSGAEPAGAEGGGAAGAGGEAGGEETGEVRVRRG